jgi:negative regulator of sigma-B (phosphoserine phosphatase)
VSATHHRPSGKALGTLAAVAHLSAPKLGERVNGDAVVLREEADGRLLVGVIDALGHGPGAEEVSQVAVEHLSKMPFGTDLGAMMEDVHRRLRGTRGAAATFCYVADGKLQACGVGNVDFRCEETKIPFIFSPGILGVRVERFRVSSARLSPATRLVFFSDGIPLVSRLEDLRALPPADACRSIFNKHRRDDDDATVLIADLG